MYLFNFYYIENTHFILENMCNTEFNAIKSLKIKILDSKIYLNGFDDIINFLNPFNKDKFLYYLFFIKINIK